MVVLISYVWYNNEVIVSREVYMLEKFKNLNISDVIINALNEMGFEDAGM